MRYYYGAESRKDAGKEKRSGTKEKQRYGTLVIEEDTVYEIDEECMRCSAQSDNLE